MRCLPDTRSGAERYKSQLCARPDPAHTCPGQPLGRGWLVAELVAPPNKLSVTTWPLQLRHSTSALAMGLCHPDVLPPGWHITCNTHTTQQCTQQPSPALHPHPPHPPALHPTTHIVCKGGSSGSLRCSKPASPSAPEAATCMLDAPPTSGAAHATSLFEAPAAGGPPSPLTLGVISLGTTVRTYEFPSHRPSTTGPCCCCC